VIKRPNLTKDALHGDWKDVMKESFSKKKLRKIGQITNGD